MENGNIIFAIFREKEAANFDLETGFNFTQNAISFLSLKLPE